MNNYIYVDNYISVNNYIYVDNYIDVNNSIYDNNNTYTENINVVKLYIRAWLNLTADFHITEYYYRYTISHLDAVSLKHVIFPREVENLQFEGRYWEHKADGRQSEH